MAYVSQERKARIVEAVKKVLPEGFKATFSVNAHCTLEMTFRQVPRDFLVDLAYKGRELNILRQSISLKYENFGEKFIEAKLNNIFDEEKARTMENIYTGSVGISINPDFAVEKLSGVFNVKQENQSVQLLKDIITALNIENYDNSDIMTDYFERGYYVNMQFGKDGKPCQII